MRTVGSMNMPAVEMLQETRDRLCAELDRLRGEDLPAARGVVDTARGAGDIGENQDMRIALFEVARIESRLAYLDDVLARAVVHVPSTDTPRTVGYGCVVGVEFAPGEVERYLYAGFEDRVEGLETLTGSSPLGAALRGASVGDTVRVQGPSGSFEVRVGSVEAL